MGVSVGLLNLKRCVQMIMSTKPMFAILFARIFLKEPCGLAEVVTISLMMTGG